MNKLFKLREWVTLPEAAKYLSIVLGEPVADHDVLRLGLDRQLVLSLILLDGVIGQSGSYVRHSEAYCRIVGRGET